MLQILNNCMKINAYMVISDRGSIRVVKTRPELNNNEIAVNLNVEIPNIFFERLMPTINIKIPEEAVLKPDIEVAVAVAAFEVSDKLKLDFKEVEDGLMSMVKAKTEEDGKDQHG